MYSSTSSNNKFIHGDVYLGLGSSCCHGCTDSGSNKDTPASSPVGDNNNPTQRSHSLSRSSPDPQGVNTVYLPKTVLGLLCNPTSHRTPPTFGPNGTNTSLIVADTGATNHMLPVKLVFISYYPISGQHARMGDNSFALILGHSTAIILLNNKKILIHG